MMIVGLWFQDLFNYDLSKIEMSGTPVGTQEGEIDFATYNAAGWRQIVEYLHKTASISDWNKTRGRHSIYANGRLIQIAGLDDVNPQSEIVAINVRMASPVDNAAT